MIQLSRRTVFRCTGIVPVGIAVTSTASCVAGGFQPTGPVIRGDGRYRTVWQYTEEDLGPIDFVGRQGFSPFHPGGPLITEVFFREELKEYRRGPGDWVYTINENEIYDVAPHRYKAHSGTRIQWHYRPFLDGVEPIEQGMPDEDYDILEEIRQQQEDDARR